MDAVKKFIPPYTWDDVRKSIMPALSCRDGLNKMAQEWKSLTPETYSGVAVAPYLDFFISYYMDFENGMVPVNEQMLERWSVASGSLLLTQTAHENLLSHIKKHSEIKIEALKDGISFINTTPAPEDEYVASIAAFPDLLTEYVELCDLKDAYVAFPNRFSVGIGPANDATWTYLQFFMIPDLYNAVPVQKRVSSSIYRFVVGKDLEIVDTLTEEKMLYFQNLKGEKAE